MNLRKLLYRCFENMNHFDKENSLICIFIFYYISGSESIHIYSASQMQNKDSFN